MEKTTEGLRRNDRRRNRFRDLTGVDLLDPTNEFPDEHDSPSLMTELAQCVAYFYKAAAELVTGK